MDVQVEKTGSYLRHVSVTVPAAIVAAALDKALKKVAKTATLPGFRPGHIPASLLEKQFGGQIQQEATNQLIEDTLYKALDANGLMPVGMPRLTSINPLVRGQDNSYRAEVEVKPEIELKTTKGLRVAVAQSAVTDEEVTAKLEKIRDDRALVVPVQDRDIVQTGDSVLLDYEGSVAGVPFDGGKADNAIVEIGGGNFIPGFAEGIVGAKVPGEIVVNVTFPADYGAAELAGKNAAFKMTLKELKTRQRPELDDELAKDMGFDDVASWRKEIQAALVTEKADKARRETEIAVLKELVANNPVELPPSLVQRQAEQMAMQTIQQFQSMYGKNAFPNMQEFYDIILKSNRADAEFQVHSGLLLAEIAEKEGLRATDEEVDAEINTRAAKMADRAEQFKQHYYSSNERMASLRFGLLEAKVIKFLLDHSTPITDGSTTPAE